MHGRITNLFKGQCLLCLSKTNTALCQGCERDCFTDNTSKCYICANKTIKNQVCGYCLLNKPIYDRTRVLCLYQYPVNHLIKTLKFQRQPQLIKVFASVFLSSLKKKGRLPETLVPVPLHPKRQKKRGFNPASILAKLLSNNLNIDFQPSLFIRNRNTPPQSELTNKERRKNVAAAFDLIRETHSKHIAIVDDVITTGSTINELAKLLKKKGVDTIEAWAIAKTNY